MKVERLYILIAGRIRELRERKEITQQDVARRIGQSRTSFVNIESGRQRITLHGLYDIATALDCEPEQLLPSAKEVNHIPMVFDGERRELSPTLAAKIRRILRAQKAKAKAGEKGD